MSIFTSGTIFSIYEGIHTITGPNEPTRSLWLSATVLGIAFLFEGASFRVAWRNLRAESRRDGESLRDLLRNPKDPTVNSVAMEDAAALIGVLIAATGVGLHALTGSRIWDGLASLAIGVLLLGVAIVLGRTCQALLVGKQADPRLLRRVEEALEENDEVVDVVDMLSMQTGTGQVLLCVRADFVNKLSAGDLEQACVRVADALHQRFADLDEIFIQPASRHDPKVRERVKQRYGAPMADE
jgi:cation diffusion facilitator family transporter